MSEELSTNIKGNIFTRFGLGVISFIVGLSAFSIMKLLFILPINFIVTPENKGLMESVSAILIVVAIYLAVKFTKKLNRTGTRKSRNIKRIITVVIGIPCLLITTFLLAVSESL